MFTGPVPDFGLKGKPKPKVRRGERKPPPLPKEVNVKTERMLRNAEVSPGCSLKCRSEAPYLSDFFFWLSPIF